MEIIHQNKHKSEISIITATSGEAGDFGTETTASA